MQVWIQHIYIYIYILFIKFPYTNILNFNDMG